MYGNVKWIAKKLLIISTREVKNLTTYLLKYYSNGWSLDWGFEMYLHILYYFIL